CGLLAAARSPPISHFEPGMGAQSSTLVTPQIKCTPLTGAQSAARAGDAIQRNIVKAVRKPVHQGACVPACLDGAMVILPHRSDVMNLSPFSVVPLERSCQSTIGLWADQIAPTTILPLFILECNPDADKSDRSDLTRGSGTGFRQTSSWRSNPQQRCRIPCWHAGCCNAANIIGEYSDKTRPNRMRKRVWASSPVKSPLSPARAVASVSRLRNCSPRKVRRWSAPRGP